VGYFPPFTLLFFTATVGSAQETATESADFEEEGSPTSKAHPLAAERNPMKRPLKVPKRLHRNHPNVVAAGYEHTGSILIGLAMQRVGLSSLEEIDVLDVGCGVRFTMTIINRDIPIKSYTGLEVHKPIVDFLNKKVARYEKRFRFVHWNVRNKMYNPKGLELSNWERLPVAGNFDLIWLFSVFTHMNPTDTQAMLKILRKHIREEGRIFFSAFIDDDVDGFEDRVKDRPLEKAYYGRNYMELIIKETGWRIEGAFDEDKSNYIQHHFICSPG
jgi:SAM-dependent methyltransferase